MTKIEWADVTWNPITGCSKISEGCENCYAEKMSKRLAGRYGYPKNIPFSVVFHEDKLHQPETWLKPKRIFLGSMTDIGHDKVMHTWFSAIMDVCQSLPRHTVMVLTKRPDGLRNKFESWMHQLGLTSLPSNIWVGVTAENQRRAYERIPELLKIPAAVRFVSVEPMLQEINLKVIPCNVPSIEGKDEWDDYFCGLTGSGYEPQSMEYGEPGKYPKIDWVICGSETGQNKRPMELSWARYLRDQCRSADVPFFMKKTSDGDPPEDLMIREFPNG